MPSYLSGALAGLGATAPMTLAMKLMHGTLPPGERCPLPLRQITLGVAESVGVKEELGEGERLGLTLASHFAYGAAAGAAYAPSERVLPGRPAVKGIAYGLAVWAGSYLGWLPALGILRPATEHPPRRTAVMIAVHIVWGAVTGLLYQRLERAE